MQALVLGFADDTDFAPPATVDPRLAEMPILRVTRRRAWRDTANWLPAVAARQPAADA